jgi:hypothetical protein
MKTIFYKFSFFIAANLVTGISMAQSANDKPVAFKDIEKKFASDHFTIREIKKKELEITPSKIVLLNNTIQAKGKEKWSRRKK